MSPKPSQLLEEIVSFLKGASGLSCSMTERDTVVVDQAIDGKKFKFQVNELADVLKRVDADGKGFIQVNFNSGTKVLFTDNLVGFKPRETFGLDMSKIPRVVTTPDLMSVFEAIEESLGSDATPEHEIEILKKVFHSILQGGELAGFDLTYERTWLHRLLGSRYRASA
jgi:hypothetical protein